MPHFLENFWDNCEFCSARAPNPAPLSVTRMPPVGPEDAALESTRLGLRFHTDLLCLQLDINPHTT